MNKQDVKQIIMKGETVKCSQEDYSDVRRYLQEIAGESIDEGQSIYAAICLAEVQRLDRVLRVAEQRDAPVHAEQKCPACDGEGTGFSEGESWTCSMCDGTGISNRSAGG